ncbi:MAG: 5'-3' exonuclease H3TH domain-containing protein, partial [Candidatus Omnitrophota bacterium]|nr:5'-3' exonuclease H3TH domain-containing protein [Candidatus Omnitrophota bacterium]
MKTKKAFLIDGTAFCYRAFYAIRSLSSSDGRPTNAVYGFAMMLQALREKERPEYLAVAFDVGKPTFRHVKYEQYKIQRKPMPDALIGQIPVIKQLLAAYRIPIFEQEGYEGEDVLATIAKQVAAPGLQVYLVTGDKDALQLVNSHVKVYNPHHEGTVLDAAAVKARYGVGPERMVDLMALMGDEIDNIPGVPGIGEKTATQLLQRFGSLERLYRSLSDLDSPHQRKMLETAREQAMLSQELARIDADVPLSVTLQELALREPDWRVLRSLFRALEFKKLLSAVDEHAPAAPSMHIEMRVVHTAQEFETFARALGRSVTAVGCWPVGDPAIGPRPSAVGRMVEQEHSGGRDVAPIGAGVQAPRAVPVGLHPMTAVQMAVAQDAKTAWVMRLDRARLDTPAGRRMSEWLGDAQAPKLLHDAKTGTGMLRRLGVTLRGISGDTMVAAYLLNPARTGQTLSDLSDEFLE